MIRNYKKRNIESEFLQLPLNLLVIQFKQMLKHHCLTILKLQIHISCTNHWIEIDGCKGIYRQDSTNFFFLFLAFSFPSFFTNSQFSLKILINFQEAWNVSKRDTHLYNLSVYGPTLSITSFIVSSIII